MIIMPVKPVYSGHPIIIMPVKPVYSGHPIIIMPVKSVYSGHPIIIMPVKPVYSGHPMIIRPPSLLRKLVQVPMSTHHSLITSLKKVKPLSLAHCGRIRQVPLHAHVRFLFSMEPHSN